MNTEGKSLKNMSYPRLSKVENSKYILSPFDKNLLIIVIFMIVVGLITTFSAMVPREIRAGINPIGIIIKQLFLELFFLNK